MVTPHHPPGYRIRRERDDDLARLLQPTIGELIQHLGAFHSPRQIYLEATRATRELQGSIDAEALPEMVARLVTVRLGRQPPLVVVGTPPNRSLGASVRGPTPA